MRPVGLSSFALECSIGMNDHAKRSSTCYMDTERRSVVSADTALASTPETQGGERALNSTSRYMRRLQDPKPPMVIP